MSENERQPSNPPANSEVAKQIVCDLVHCIAERLVDNPDEVQISSASGETSTIIELKVNKDDMGKVIGSQGKTIKAIRQILTAVSAKYKIKVILHLPED